MQKTYNSGDSPVVTHPSTNPPVSCLSTAERTGSAVSKDPMVVCEGIGVVALLYCRHSRKLTEETAVAVAIAPDPIAKPELALLIISVPRLRNTFLV